MKRRDDCPGYDRQEQAADGYRRRQRQTEGGTGTDCFHPRYPKREIPQSSGRFLNATGRNELTSFEQYCALWQESPAVLGISPFRIKRVETVHACPALCLSLPPSVSVRRLLLSVMPGAHHPPPSLALLFVSGLLFDKKLAGDEIVYHHDTRGKGLDEDVGPVPETVQKQRASL